MPASQEVQQETPRPQLPSLAAVATAPDVIAEQTAAVPAAPRQGAPNPFDSSAARTWTAQLHAAILRNKRYPTSARANGQQGITRVSFAIDRQGRLVDSRIMRSSGVAVLDEEALAVLKRAQPFAVPPAGLGNPDRVTVDVPISFTLK